MPRYIRSLTGKELEMKKQKDIISTKIGDINGSSGEDIVYLVGNKNGTGKNTIYSNMQIIISDGETGSTNTIDLRGIEGYNPKIMLENFKINKCKEILFTIEDIGNDGNITAEVYEIDGDNPIKIFDTNYYNREESYEVIYKDNYTVNVVDISGGVTYVIDISKKDKNYLNNLYDEKGKLRRKITGKVLPISGISTIDLRRSDVVDMLEIQKIIGINKNDILGTVNYILSLRDAKFEKIDSFVAILGEKTPNLLARGEDKIGNDRNNKISIDFSKVEFIESETSKDNSIERVIEKEFQLNPEEDKVNYLYNRVKLKDNNSYQILVYLEGPRFCSEKGGTLAILEEKNNEYKVISKISNATNPIIISEEKTNGYRDLILKVLDKEKEDFRLLKFNGNAYPLDPTKEEKLRKGSKIRGIAAISDDLFYTRGFEYK